MSEFISVTVLNNYIKNIVDAEEMLHNICVVGEISQFKTSGPHAYFSIKDENSELACTFFNYKNSEYIPKAGETVLLTGSVDYYLKGGRLSFKARKIAPYGIGAIALRLEELKKKLALGGYFDEAHKKPIPKFANKICVLTAKTGAVIHDIITTARKNNRIIDIDVFPVKVQGEGSSESIIKALKIVDVMGYDAIIIARGGGSLEDLMGFNDEKLVYAIYDAFTPVISAVGHETDITLCDLAADRRVPTPTAAAELVAFNVQNIKEIVIASVFGMQKLISAHYGTIIGNYTQLSRRIAADGKNLVLFNRMNAEKILKRIETTIQRKIEKSNQELKLVAAKIDSKSPLKILKQGYSRAEKDGIAIDDAELATGDEITVISARKKVTAEVTSLINMRFGENYDN